MARVVADTVVYNHLQLVCFRGNKSNHLVVQLVSFTAKGVPGRGSSIQLLYGRPSRISSSPGWLALLIPAKVSAHMKEEQQFDPVALMGSRHATAVRRRERTVDEDSHMLAAADECSL